MYAARAGHGFFLVGSIIHVIVLIAIAAAIYFIVRRWPSKSGMRQLRESFARGEIDEDTYRARLAVLRDTARY